MMVSKRNLLFQGLLFRFHVEFQECRWFRHFLISLVFFKLSQRFLGEVIQFDQHIFFRWVDSNHQLVLFQERNRLMVIPKDLWSWYIYLHIDNKDKQNVGQYTIWGFIWWTFTSLATPEETKCRPCYWKSD